MFSSVPFWLGAVYVCFPLGLLTYGWNDLGDNETDRFNPRKDSWLFGAIPNATLRKHLPWIILATQVPFLVIFTWGRRPQDARMVRGTCHCQHLLQHGGL